MTLNNPYAQRKTLRALEKFWTRIEGFVKNVFDDDSWAACARWTDFDSAPTLGQLTTYQGVAVTPNMPRQYGIRLAYKF